MKKYLFALLFLALLPLQAAKADGFPWDDHRDRWDHSNPRGGADYCVARDRGWEEHWGSHNSCGECLRKHGKCVESCYEREYRVVVVGFVGDRWDDRRQREEEFFGRGRSDWEAEEDALRQCRWSRAYNCSVRSHDTQDREISTRSCN